jgi:hypothetical protein
MVAGRGSLLATFKNQPLSCVLRCTLGVRVGSEAVFSLRAPCRLRCVTTLSEKPDPEEERNRAKEALTELFREAKNSNTHIIVERIVTDIDDIVKKVRFPDWQHTSQGERLVQKELRRTLLKYKLHADQELFDKAYSYIRQYY